MKSVPSVEVLFPSRPERHYVPWVRARRERAEGDVKRSWERDPIVLLETKGTPEVHEKSEAVN